MQSDDAPGANVVTPLLGLGPRVDRRALDALLATPDEPQLLLQPIVDLARGVTAGYEALARFPAWMPGPTEEWFLRARTFGLGAELNARCIERALQARPRLPPTCFLSINCGPDVLASPAVTAAFAAESALTGVVIELTEHVDLGSCPRLRAALANVRSRGALVAIDDAGSGYAGLVQMLDIRPDLVKLDKELVRGIDRDPAKAAAVELLGAFASRLDAWLLAEGVESVAELDAVLRLGVPLAQGWALGRPTAECVSPGSTLGGRLHRRSAPNPTGDTVAAVLTATPPLRPGDPSWSPAHPDDARVRVDDSDCPVALCLPRRRQEITGGARESSGLLRMPALTPLSEAALRAVCREPDQRFDPLVCVDGTGRYLGLVRVDHLLAALARRCRSVIDLRLPDPSAPTR